MKWLVDCLNSIYTSSCVDKSSVCTLPPFTIKELSPIIPIDCKGCDKPCLHPPLPNLDIDQFKPMKNTVTPYAVHLIIMTGKTDWPAHIEDEGLARAFIEAIRKRKNSDRRAFENRFHPAYDIHKDEERDDPMNHRVVISNCSLPSTYSKSGTDVLLLPDNIVISNITPKKVDALLDYIYNKECFQAFSVYPFPYSSLILICGHGNKDSRCGTIGPIIEAALHQASLNATKKEAESVKIALVSHLGGHVFAGNMVVYTYYGQRAIWYGRVTPCHCKDILENTVDNDKVIDNLVRGVFEVKTRPKVCQSSLDW